jgi:hypothetical protein
MLKKGGGGGHHFSIRTAFCVCLYKENRKTILNLTWLCPMTSIYEDEATLICSIPPARNHATFLRPFITSIFGLPQPSYGLRHHQNLTPQKATRAQGTQLFFVLPEPFWKFNFGISIILSLVLHFSPLLK